MKIVSQSPARNPLVAVVIVTMVPFCSLDEQAAAQNASGQIQCKISKNGAPATGTIAIQQNGKDVAHGSCGASLRTPPGTYRAIVRLGGALDQPLKRVAINVRADGVAPVEVDFRTGTLEVRILAKGRSGTGMVTVHRGRKRVGTLGAGVAADLSEGKYEVVVTYGGQKRVYPIELRAGQRRLVRAQF